MSAYTLRTLGKAITLAEYHANRQSGIDYHSVYLRMKYTRHANCMLAIWQALPVNN